MSRERQPLLIEWSPAWVWVHDSVTKETVDGPTISTCVKDGGGREAIVAVSQRSAFVRSVPVPALSREETAKTLAYKMGTVLPLNGQEVAYGFRLGKESRADGNAAIVGAIKTESLRRIHQEVNEAGLKVRAVLPIAFGSWLAARAWSLADCAVVHANKQSLSIDVIEGRELRYSRIVPLPTTQEEIDQEIETTFCIAKAPTSPVLSSASPSIKAAFVDRRRTLEYFADPRVIDRLLFSIELPEKTQARRAKVSRCTAQRAIFAAVVALAFGGYAYQKRYSEEAVTSDKVDSHHALIVKARAKEKTEEAASDKATQAKAILDLAFKPAQSISDIVSVLGADAPPGVWLTGLTVERGRDLLVRGTATDGRLASKYVANLAKRSRFRDVTLAFANHATIGKKEVVQFGISGHAVGNFPISELPIREVKK